MGGVLLLLIAMIAIYVVRTKVVPAVRISQTRKRPPEPTVRQALLGDIEELHDLHKRGVLTDDEFASAKARLIDAPSQVQQERPVIGRSARSIMQPDGSLKCLGCGGTTFETRRSTGMKIGWGAASLLGSPNEVHCVACGARYKRR